MLYEIDEKDIQGMIRLCDDAKRAISQLEKVAGSRTCVGESTLFVGDLADVTYGNIDEVRSFLDTLTVPSAKIGTVLAYTESLFDRLAEVRRFNKAVRNFLESIAEGDNLPLLDPWADSAIKAAAKMLEDQKYQFDEAQSYVETIQQKLEMKETPND